MSNLKGIISAAMAEGPMPQKFSCKYCNAKFMKETTLLAHMCEPKRRHQQKDEVGVRIGFHAWVRFYEITQGIKNKTMDDFIKSPYYVAFVKFGRYAHSIRAVNPAAMADWMITNNRKLDQWCRDSFYDQFLVEYMGKERPSDALERSIVEIGKWAEEANLDLCDFFRKGSPYKISAMISDGRVSPWVVYCSDSGTEFLSSLPEEDLTRIWKCINPSFWQKKLDLYGSDALWCRNILTQSGF